MENLTPLGKNIVKIIYWTIILVGLYRLRAWRQAEERGLRQTRVRWRSEQLYLLKNKKGRVLKTINYECIKFI